MVDEAQRQRTTFPNEVDALAKQQYDWNRANTEFSRFHAKSDPTAQMYEQAAYEQRGNPGFFNARSPRVFENTQWSPNYPGPKFDTRFIVGSSGSSEGLESLNRGEYYDRMKGSEQNWMDVLKEDVRHRLGISNEPGMGAGITNQNLNGYKVMNAGWRDWINPFGNKIDELNVENQRLLKEMDDIRMHPLFPEPGPWNEFDPARREMEYYNDMMDMDDGGDGGVVNPDDYINVRHDMGDDAEEEGGGWLSNPFKDLRRRRREHLRNRDPSLNDLFFKRMMEENLKFQMDMLMNPNKFNTSPGTGDINPIFGDPYWNI